MPEPRDPVTAYLERFEELRLFKRWSTDVNMLRFAALVLTGADLPELGDRLEQAANRIKKKAGAFGTLNSPTRHIVAAMLVRRGLEIDQPLEQVDRVRGLFRAEKLKRGGIHEALAALLLVLQAGEREVDVWTVRRMREILARWKKDHPWLTGIGDYPMAALYAARGVSPETIGHRVESIYQALRRERQSSGDSLQLASHLLAISDLDPTQAARSFAGLRRALKAAGIRTGSSQYDEVALLVLMEDDPSAVAERMAGAVARLMSVRPRPQKSIAISLASGLLMNETLARRGLDAEERDLTALQAALAVVEAQQAAMVAIFAGSTAASAAT